MKHVRTAGLAILYIALGTAGAMAIYQALDFLEVKYKGAKKP